MKCEGWNKSIWQLVAELEELNRKGEVVDEMQEHYKDLSASERFQWLKYSQELKKQKAATRAA